MSKPAPAATATASDFFAAVGNVIKSCGMWGMRIDGAGRGTLGDNVGNANVSGGVSQVNIVAGQTNASANNLFT